MPEYFDIVRNNLHLVGLKHLYEVVLFKFTNREIEALGGFRVFGYVKLYLEHYHKRNIN